MKQWRGTGIRFKTTSRPKIKEVSHLLSNNCYLNGASGMRSVAVSLTECRKSHLCRPLKQGRVIHSAVAKRRWCNLHRVLLMAAQVINEPRSSSRPAPQVQIQALAAAGEKPKEKELMFSAQLLEDEKLLNSWHQLAPNSAIPEPEGAGG